MELRLAKPTGVAEAALVAPFGIYRSNLRHTVLGYLIFSEWPDAFEWAGIVFGIGVRFGHGVARSCEFQTKGCTAEFSALAIAQRKALI